MASHPVLYEWNIRVHLADLSSNLGRHATLDDLPPSELDRLAELGFEWIWLLGVWQTGEAGRRVSRTSPQLRQSYQQVLPDVAASDICGSPFAVASYTVSPDLGGDGALARFRERLKACGMRLMLDFVPNHTAIDHPWAREHPDYYVHGSDNDREREPLNYLLVPEAGIFAYGRDPYFPGWPDTLQLNYGSPALQDAMRNELIKIAAACDGVRCDMAMLLTPEVFKKTWGIEARPFWPETIQAVRAMHPEFIFMAEVYWGMEWDLQQQGFDHTYDKRLYDRLRSGDANAVRAHLTASLEFQNKSVRFLENHDEERAADVFPPSAHQAAAMIAYFVPGMRFFHDGQLEGRHKKTSVHLCRRAAEKADQFLESFYMQLLAWLRQPVLRTGEWQMLETTPDSCFAFAWSDERNRALVVVNFSPDPAQCRADAEMSFDLPGWGYKFLLLRPDS